MATTVKTFLLLLLSAFSCLAQGDVEDLMLLRVPAAPAGGSPSSLVTNLVAYWRMDETSGTRYDVVGTNHLTDNYTVGYSTGVITNSALLFSNQSEYLSVPDGPDTSTEGQSFTICLWVKMYLTNISHAFVSKYLSGLNSREFEFSYNSTKPRFVYWTDSSCSGCNVTTISSVSLGPTNNWYFLSAVANISISKIILFQGNSSGTVQTWTTNSFTITNQVGGASMFQFGLGGYSGWKFDGELDEAGFWKRALTQSEITNLYNGGTGRTYPFTGAP